MGFVDNMNDPGYTVKEIMELQFKSMDMKLDDIRSTLKDQNIQTEKRFAQIDAEIADVKKDQQILKEDNARFKVIWGIGSTIGASAVALITTQLFK